MSRLRIQWKDFTKDFLDAVYDVEELKRLYNKQELTSRSKVAFRCFDCGEPCVHDILHYWNAQSGWKRQPRCEQCRKKTAKVRLLETINENKVYDADLVSMIPEDCPEKPLFAQKKIGCETVLHIPCASCKTPLEIKWRYVTRDKKFLCKQCQGLEYSRMMRRKFLDKYPAIKSVIVDMDKFLSGDDERNGMETMIQCRCQKCGNAFVRSWLSLKNCADNNRSVFCDNCLHHTSSLENEMCAFIDSLNVTYERRKHLFVGDKSSWFEVDVFIPEKNVAIEMNGSYWHATLGRNQIATKAKDYHMNKFILCKEMGIRLISVFDYDWFTKQDKVKRTIRDALVERKRIYARQCTIRQATNKECAVFFAGNHFDGHASNASFFVVLEHDGSIVAAMSFGHPRGVSIDDKSETNETNETKEKGKSIEMYRYATKEGITVVGGVSRCLSFALKQITHNGGEYASIVTYSDNNLFTGDVYERLGFEQQRMTEEYFWSDLGETFFPRYATQKSKLCNLFEDVTADDVKTKTENDIMIEHGFVKVYTAGNTRWLKSLKNVKEK